MNATGSSTSLPPSDVQGTPEFFGSERRMFGCSYIPDGARAGVVICPSLYAESLSNYRAEVALARELATRGVAVQRFHYRGTGHSDDLEGGFTFASMRADADVATEHLRKGASVDKVAFLGARWGALVAAGAASTSDAPVVLWEPSLDPVRYFKEVNRFRLVHEMQKGIPSNQEPMIDVLERDGRFDMLGYRLEASFYTSSLGHTLPDELGDRPRAVLLVQLAAKKELRGEYRKLVDRLKTSGSRVDIECLQEAPVWWLLRPPIRTLADLVATSAGWLERVLGEV